MERLELTEEEGVEADVGEERVGEMGELLVVLTLLMLGREPLRDMCTPGISCESNLIKGAGLRAKPDVVFFLKDLWSRTCSLAASQRT